MADDLLYDVARSRHIDIANNHISAGKTLQSAIPTTACGRTHVLQREVLPLDLYRLQRLQTDQ